MSDWYVYMVSNNTHTLYTGMTNDLPNRVRQQKDRTYENAFTARYTFDRLVWFETQPSRAKRIALIQAMNPNWIDLHRTWTDIARDLLR